ncbi:reverse transcriptase domain-containing protein [Tanacetum coccineum]
MNASSEWRKANSTTKGIKADPENIRALISKPFQKNPKQIRSLCLPLMDLGRFLPKLVELTLSFQDIPRGYGAEGAFRWTARAEKALQKVKKEMGMLQTLVIPREYETLMVCLRPKSETINAVLFTKIDDLQVSIHYVRRPLQEMEILKCLKKCFRTHGVRVVTDDPIEQILRNPVEKEQESRAPKKDVDRTSGTMKVSWEHLDPGPRAWILYICSEAKEEGYGVGLLLLDPEEKEYYYVPRLNFRASETDMKYEALLTGLDVVFERQIKDLHVFVDSKLMIDQVKGHKEAKKGKTKRYRGGGYECNNPFLQVSDHSPSYRFKPKSKGIDGVDNHLVGLPNPGSIRWDKD